VSSELVVVSLGVVRVLGCQSPATPALFLLYPPSPDCACWQVQREATVAVQSLAPAIVAALPWGAPAALHTHALYALSRFAFDVPSARCVCVWDCVCVWGGGMPCCACGKEETTVGGTHSRTENGQV
jgi:hypothetical protein